MSIKLFLLRVWGTFIQFFRKLMFGVSVNHSSSRFSSSDIRRIPHELGQLQYVPTKSEQPVFSTHSPSHYKEIRVRPRPGQQAAIFLHHLPSVIVKKVFPQLSQEEVKHLGREMISVSLLPEETRHHAWNQLLRWLKGNIEDHESIARLLHQLLSNESFPFQGNLLERGDKVAMLLRLLNPRECNDVGAKLLERVNRSNQEALILALRQVPNLLESEKGGVLQEFFSFMRTSSISRNSTSNLERLEEIERVGLHLPLHVAQCLETCWLHPNNLLLEWRELAEKHPDFATEKLANFLCQNASTETPLSNFDKAVFFLRMIHPEIRDEIIKHLKTSDVHLIMSEVEKAEKPWRITNLQKQTILEEFLGQYYFLTTAKLLEIERS